MSESTAASAGLNGTDGKCSPRNELFQGARFWISRRCPSRQNFVEQVRNNGGKIVSLEQHAEYLIVDHLRKDLPPGSLSYSFIEQSIKNGKIEDAEAYRAGPPVGIVRGTPSARPMKGRRVPFTAEDDRQLCRWVEDRVSNGCRASGNQVYMDFEAKNPRHPWHSWRDRYVKYLSKTSSAVAHPSPAISSSGGDADTRVARSKRQRAIFLGLSTQEELESVPQSLGTTGDVDVAQSGEGWEASARNHLPQLRKERRSSDDKKTLSIHLKNGDKRNVARPNNSRPIASGPESRQVFRLEQNCVIQSAPKGQESVFAKTEHKTRSLPVLAAESGAQSLDPKLGDEAEIVSRLTNGHSPSVQCKRQCIESVNGPRAVHGQEETSQRNTFVATKIYPSFNDNSAAHEKSEALDNALSSQPLGVKFNRLQHSRYLGSHLIADPGEVENLTWHVSGTKGEQENSQNFGYQSSVVGHELQVLDKNRTSDSARDDAIKEVVCRVVRSQCVRKHKPFTNDQDSTHILSVFRKTPVQDPKGRRSPNWEIQNREACREEDPNPAPLVPLTASDLSTQALFETETQVLDLGIVEPEGGFGDEEDTSVTEMCVAHRGLEGLERLWQEETASRELVMEATVPEQVRWRQPGTAWRPHLGRESNKDGGLDPSSPFDLDSYINSLLKRGYAEPDVILALKCTSMIVPLAEAVLPHLKAGKGVPIDMPGVWTPEDDLDLEGSDGRGIRRVEEKHGRDTFMARIKYLSEWRDAK